MVFQHLRALVALVFIFHGLGPDAPGHTADHRIFRIDAIAEEEGQVGRKIIDIHAPAQVIFHISKAVGQGKCQLRNRIGACLGNMVAGDGYRIKIPHLFVDEILLHIAHHPQGKFGGEDAGVLRLVFFQNIGLHGAAHGCDGVSAFIFS